MLEVALEALHQIGAGGRGRSGQSTGDGARDPSVDEAFHGGVGCER